jgi:hypothetical protein
VCVCACMCVCMCVCVCAQVEEVAWCGLLGLGCVGLCWVGVVV